MGFSHECISTHEHTRKYAHTQTYTHTDTNLYTRSITHIQTQTHKRMYTRTHTRMHTPMIAIGDNATRYIALKNHSKFQLDHGCQGRLSRQIDDRCGTLTYLIYVNLYAGTAWHETCASNTVYSSSARDSTSSTLAHSPR